MMRVESRWTDLNTRGFVVVRNFLSPDAVSRILQPYLDDQGEERGFVPAAFLGPAGKAVVSELEGAVRGVAPAIFEETTLRLNAFDPFTAYFPNSGNRWHTDPPPYWMFQDLTRYVNVWIPLLKPAKDRSGLSVIPLDRLQEKDPAMYEATRGCGAAGFAPPSVIAKGDEELAEFLFTARDRATVDEHFVLDRGGQFVDIEPKVNLDDIAVSPDLAAGDAIFCRGDVIHATQDNLEPARIAISIRALDGDMRVRKDFLTGLTPFSRRLLANPQGPFVAPLLGAFELSGKDDLSAKEVIDFFLATRGGAPANVEVVAAIRPKLKEIFGVTSHGPQV